MQATNSKRVTRFYQDYLFHRESARVWMLHPSPPPSPTSSFYDLETLHINARHSPNVHVAEIVALKRTDLQTWTITGHDARHHKNNRSISSVNKNKNYIVQDDAVDDQPVRTATTTTDVSLVRTSPSPPSSPFG